MFVFWLGVSSRELPERGEWLFPLCCAISGSYDSPGAALDLDVGRPHHRPLKPPNSPAEYRPYPPVLKVVKCSFFPESVRFFHWVFTLIYLRPEHGESDRSATQTNCVFITWWG